VTLQQRDKRALIGLGVAALLMLLYWISGSSPGTGGAKVVAAVDSIDRQERRLGVLRKQVATLNGKEAVLKQASVELADREKGLIPGDTAEQAQAQLLEILKRIGKDQNPPLEIRQVDLAPALPYGDAYGVVTLAINMDCRIDELVNFLAQVGAQPEIMSTSEIRFGASRPKEKTMPIQVTVSGLVAGRLAPAKKGLPQL